MSYGPNVVADSYYVKRIIILLLFSILAILASVLRLWARRIKKLSFELDDYLILLGLIFTVVCAAMSIHGFLAFAIESHEDVQKTLIESQFLGPLIWVASVTAIRASIITLYARIFIIRPYRLVCYSVLAINIVFCLSVVLADCLICRPISYRWDRSIRGGTCGRQQSLDFFIAIFNFVLDVCLVVMPMPALWGLKMKTSKKIALTGIFGLGTTVCALTLYRIYVTTTISEGNIETAYSTIGLLACLEALLGIINACLPLLKPVFGKMRSLVPKIGKGNGAYDKPASNDNTTSGSIPIILRVSQLWSKMRGMYTTSDGGPSSPKTSEGKHSLDVAKRSLRGPKANRVLGMEVPEIHVCEEVEVRSVWCDDEVPFKKSAGGVIRW